ncbi:hypothetical protein BS78_10G049000 [Paspalum vaginatum]|nr:hypothetical protein BS78_10G049000 [Paspalum vaginatum]
MEGPRQEGGGVWRPPAPAAEATTGATRQRQQVKVKHIVTKEVSTDQASFKDVVQRLTGKDSAAARTSVVVAGADGGTSSWSGGGAAVATGGSAAGVLSQDNVVGGEIGAVLLPQRDNVAGATTLPSSGQGTERWWRGA